MKLACSQSNTLNKKAYAKLRFFAQFGSDFALTTNNYVRQRILHVVRDADDISRVKTDELHADVLIADIIKKPF